jgi:hypothetical protein
VCVKPPPSFCMKLRRTMRPRPSSGNDATAGQGYNPSSKQRRIQPALASSATAPGSAKSPPAPPAQVQRFQNVTEWRLV